MITRKQNQTKNSSQGIDYRGWRSCTIDITYAPEDGAAGLTATLDRAVAEATAAINSGFRLIVLSDRNAGADRVAVSALLAVGRVHQALVTAQLRARIGLLVETAEAREVHHMCTLVGFGADGICPYLALAAIHALQVEGKIKPKADGKLQTRAELDAAYFKAAEEGMLKVKRFSYSFNTQVCTVNALKVGGWGVKGMRRGAPFRESPVSPGFSHNHCRNKTMADRR